MKPLSIVVYRSGQVLLALACAIALASCADPMEKRSTSEVQEQIGRGISGEGTIGPEQREPNDPAAEHGVPQTHP